MKDLCLLVADSNMQQVMEAALLRPESLGIRPITFNLIVHPQRDGGVRTSGSKLLGLQRSQFMHGLMMLDFEGCGTQFDNAIDLETDLDKQLILQWNSNAKAITIEPELDIWMWGSDNALRETLGWPIDDPLREWLRRRGFEFSSNDKPVRPKEAMEKILIEIKMPRSSAIYRKIASKISLRRCSDPAFMRLRDTLVSWFPVLQ
jgi:hypothetical protein